MCTRIYECCLNLWSKRSVEEGLELPLLKKPKVQYVHRKLADRSVFFGQFSGNTGTGVRSFPNGNYWEGDFRGFVLHGKGKMVFKRESFHRRKSFQDKILEGIFENGFLVDGFQIDKNGWMVGKFENCELVRGKVYNSAGELLEERNGTQTDSKVGSSAALRRRKPHSDRHCASRNQLVWPRV